MFSIYKHLLYDVRLYLFVYFLLRLAFITAPPLETAHGWRQSTGLMVARNFYEVDANIMYPRLNNGGEKTGITGTEFPIYNYLIYLVARVFGWADWYGRLINLLVSSLGVYWFYRIILLSFSNSKWALLSALVLLNSIWFAYSRKTMPDTFSISLVLGGLYYGYSYLKFGRWAHLSPFVLLSMLGVLCKIPSAFALALFAILLLNSKFTLSRRLIILVGFIVIAIPVGWWYFKWVPHLVQKFGFWHYYMGEDLALGFHEIITHLPQTFERFYYSAMYFSGFAFFLLGIYFAVRHRQWQLITTVGISFLLIFAFASKAGYAFYHHNYYIIPFVPVLALCAGYGLSQLNNRKLIASLIVILFTETIINSRPEFMYRRTELYKLQIENTLDRFSTRKDLIATNTGDNPQLLYFAHRNGWTNTSAALADSSKQVELVNLGLKFIVFNKHETETAIIKLPLVFENEDFKIYKTTAQ